MSASESEQKSATMFRLKTLGEWTDLSIQSESTRWYLTVAQLNDQLQQKKKISICELM